MRLLCLNEISITVINEFRTVWNSCPNSRHVYELPAVALTANPSSPVLSLVPPVTCSSFSDQKKKKKAKACSPECASLHVKTLLQPLSTSLCLTSPQAARDECRRVCPASFGSAFTPCTRSPVSFYKQPHLQELACCMKVTKHTEQMTSRIPTVSSNWGPSKDTINNPNNIDFWSILFVWCCWSLCNHVCLSKTQIFCPMTKKLTNQTHFD